MGVLKKYIPCEKPWALLVSMVLHAALFALPLAFLTGGEEPAESIVTAHLLGEFQVTAPVLDMLELQAPSDGTVIEDHAKETDKAESAGHRSVSEQRPAGWVTSGEEPVADESAIARDTSGWVIGEVEHEVARTTTPGNGMPDKPGDVEDIAKFDSGGVTDGKSVDDNAAEDTALAKTALSVANPLVSPEGTTDVLAIIREKINQARHYPPIARKKGWEGTSTVRFSVDVSGGIVSIEVVRSSGVSVLDAATVRAIKDGAPYPPIGGWIQLPVTYKLTGSGLHS